VNKIFRLLWMNLKAALIIWSGANGLVGLFIQHVPKILTFKKPSILQVSL
jgi:hypothetical protein